MFVAGGSLMNRYRSIIFTFLTLGVTAANAGKLTVTSPLSNSVVGTAFAISGTCDPSQGDVVIAGQAKRNSHICSSKGTFSFEGSFYGKKNGKRIVWIQQDNGGMALRVVLDNTKPVDGGDNSTPVDDVTPPIDDVTPPIDDVTPPIDDVTTPIDDGDYKLSVVSPATNSVVGPTFTMTGTCDPSQGDVIIAGQAQRERHACTSNGRYSFEGKFFGKKNGKRIVWVQQRSGGMALRVVLDNGIPTDGEDDTTPIDDGVDDTTPIDDGEDDTTPIDDGGDDNGRDPASGTDPKIGQSNNPISMKEVRIHRFCEKPAERYSRILYVDGDSGVDARTGRGSISTPYKSLNYLVTNKILTPGDHIKVVAGSFPEFYVNQWNSPAFKTATAWTHLDFSENVTISSIRFRGIKKVVLSGAHLNGDPSLLAEMYNNSDLVLYNNHFEGSLKQKKDLSIAEWMRLPSGLLHRDSPCLSFVNNRMSKVRHAFDALTNGQTAPANNINAIVQNNTLDGVSGDFFRMNGSEMVFKANMARDGYIDPATGDGNHDDFLQGFAMGGKIYQNILIEDNFFIEREDVNNPLSGKYQGIGAFDGKFKNIMIRNNFVLISAYQGINILGGENVTIKNNTLVGVDVKMYAWIACSKMKSGQPSVNCVVENNFAEHIAPAGITVNRNNQKSDNPYGDLEKFSFKTKTFNPRSKKDSSIGAQFGDVILK